MAHAVRTHLQAERERPGRRYDQDRERAGTYVRRPIKDLFQTRGASAQDAGRMYRMDIELGRLEFVVHPSMTQEDLLVGYV